MSGCQHWTPADGAVGQVPAVECQEIGSAAGLRRKEVQTVVRIGHLGEQRGVGGSHVGGEPEGPAKRRDLGIDVGTQRVKCVLDGHLPLLRIALPETAFHGGHNPTPGDSDDLLFGGPRPIDDEITGPGACGQRFPV